VALALVIIAIATCSTTVAVAACPPEPDTKNGTLLQEARQQANFPLVYPCDLPASERFETYSVVGMPGRQQAEFAFEGPFEIKVRQAQFAPTANADPAGTSRVDIDLYPNVRATLLERNDGSSKARYHLLWEQAGIYYEVQAVGPPLQRQAILRLARSLQ
jgi:hypothetical protein